MHPSPGRYIRAPFFALCWTLDVVYNKRPIQRFWVLETVARIPYFAYIRQGRGALGHGSWVLIVVC